ncbi:peptidoglycan-binding domain-containing protein [Neorhizobium galegae]|uniref:peptidoglycan-binding domain-containing protein n=1 Tax=Neorhizobium galegae TaxID=399 RepID=UPI0027D83D3F|nr:peptidoglycan-binding domain-containing protein [Neorhizobium galegae]
MFSRASSASRAHVWGGLLLSVILIFALLIAAPTAIATTIRPVPDVQRALAAEGFDPGTPDGFWGKKSVAALRSFQKSRGLPETGVIDNTALAILFPATVVESSSLPETKAVSDKIATAVTASASAAQPTTPVKMDLPPQRQASGTPAAWALFFLLFVVGGFVFLVRRGRRVRYRSRASLTTIFNPYISSISILRRFAVHLRESRFGAGSRLKSACSHTMLRQWAFCVPVGYS